MGCQDKIRHNAKIWIDEANNAYGDQMHTETQDITINKASPPATTDLPKDDSISQALTSCQISMPLTKLYFPASTKWSSP